MLPVLNFSHELLPNDVTHVKLSRVVDLFTIPMAAPRINKEGMSLGCVHGRAIL